eukprot:ctg_122.g52
MCVRVCVRCLGWRPWWEKMGDVGGCLVLYTAWRVARTPPLRGVRFPAARKVLVLVHTAPPVLSFKANRSACVPPATETAGWPLPPPAETPRRWRSACVHTPATAAGSADTPRPARGNRSAGRTADRRLAADATAHWCARRWCQRACHVGAEVLVHQQQRSPAGRLGVDDALHVNHAARSECARGAARQTPRTADCIARPGRRRAGQHPAADTLAPDAPVDAVPAAVVAPAGTPSAGRTPATRAAAAAARPSRGAPRRWTLPGVPVAKHRRHHVAHNANGACWDDRGGPAAASVRPTRNRCPGETTATDPPTIVEKTAAATAIAARHAIAARSTLSPAACAHTAPPAATATFACRIRATTSSCATCGVRYPPPR